MDFENAFISFLIIASLAFGYEASASQSCNGMPHIAVMQIDNIDESFWKSNLNFETN